MNFSLFKILTLFTLFLTSLSCGGGFTFEFSSSKIELPCLVDCGPIEPNSTTPLDPDGFALTGGFPLYLVATPTFTWSPPKGGLPPFTYSLIVSEQADCLGRVNQAKTSISSLEFELKLLTFEGLYHICLTAIDAEKKSVSAKPFQFTYANPKQIRFSKEFLTAARSTSVLVEDFEVSLLDRNANLIIGQTGLKVLLKLNGPSSEGLDISGNATLLEGGIAHFETLTIQSSEIISGSFNLTATLEGVPDLKATVIIQID